MRLALSLAAVMAAAVAPSPALAQANGMDCYGMQGGRAMCTASRDAIYDNLNRQARANREGNAREHKLVRAVAQAVHDGHCEEALALALKSDNPMVAANTARLCGVPEAPPPGAETRAGS
jgi:hypothetical protein